MNRSTEHLQNSAGLPSLPQDAKLEALLDQVLMPDAPPATLADRIFTATVNQLPQPSRHILARWGQYAWVRSMAASIVIIASAGIVLTLGSIFHNAHNWVTLKSDFRDTIASLHLSSMVPTPPASSPLVKLDTTSLRRELDAVQTALDQVLPFIEPPNNNSDYLQL